MLGYPYLAVARHAGKGYAYLAVARHAGKGYPYLAYPGRAMSSLC